MRTSDVITDGERILVIGATGSLGQRVVARLRAEGRQVRVLTRRPFAALRAFAGDVEALEWHPQSEAIPAEALVGVVAVVNLAGEPFAGPASEERLRRMRESRLLLAGRLADALAGRDVRVVVPSVLIPPATASADTVVTDLTAREPPADEFERACLDVEAAVGAVVGGSAGVAIPRFGLILDAGAMLDALIRNAVRGRLPRLEGARIPVIDPLDAAALISGLVAHRGLSGPVIAVAPEALSGEVLATALARFRRLPVVLPGARRTGLRSLGPLARLVVNRARVVPQRLIEAGATFQHPDAAQRLTGVLDEIASRAAAREPTGMEMLVRWRPSFSR